MDAPGLVAYATASVCVVHAAAAVTAGHQWLVATVYAPGPWALLPHCQHWMPNRVDKNRARVDGIIDRWMPLHACTRAPWPPPPPPRLYVVGRVSNTRARGRMQAPPSSPGHADPSAPHRTSPSESGPCARTMDCTDNDDVCAC